MDTWCVFQTVLIKKVNTKLSCLVTVQCKAKVSSAEKTSIHYEVNKNNTSLVRSGNNSVGRDQYRTVSV